MRVTRLVNLLAVLCFVLLLPLSQIHAQPLIIGTPTWRSLVGSSVAQSLAQEALQQTNNEMSNSSNINYVKALRKYKRKLKRLQNKHARLLEREKQQLQRLINDMVSYSREDAGRGTVNQKQSEKQRKMYEYAQKCQENDRMRTREIKQFKNEHRPKIESFMTTL